MQKAYIFLQWLIILGEDEKSGKTEGTGMITYGKH